MNGCGGNMEKVLNIFKITEMETCDKQKKYF